MQLLQTTAQLLFVGLCITSCTGSVAEAPLEVTAPAGQIDPILSSIEMSVPWLAAQNLDPGQIVLVPSDHAVLSLDADALASLATETLEGEVLQADTDWDPHEPGIGVDQVLVTVDDRELPLRVDQSMVRIADIGIQEVIEWNGVTVVVMDGVLLK